MVINPYQRCHLAAASEFEHTKLWHKKRHYIRFTGLSSRRSLAAEKSWLSETSANVDIGYITYNSSVLNMRPGVLFR